MTIAPFQPSIAPDIELPIEGDWDINGWDLRKAINLLIKANPVLLEWLSSPLRYAWSPEICAQLSAFAQRTAFAAACLHHYHKLADSQWQRHVAGKQAVNFKKYFYILRPALAIHWIRANPEITPPMNLQDLVNGLPLNAELVQEIERLLPLKAQAKEIGQGTRVACVDAYIQDQLNWSASLPRRVSLERLTQDGEALFRAIVKGQI